jgi:hypothetical protein
MTDAARLGELLSPVFYVGAILLVVVAVRNSRRKHRAAAPAERPETVVDPPESGD